MASSPEIQLLPSEVIDQIAAGEVVERPASVVKELVENAIDAGAKNVAVEIEGGGKRRIRVIDDGRGMTADQAALALKRHATSKLRRIDDLVGIATMGFRGEALASIAAVSRLTLTTRPRGDESVGGTRVELEGGDVRATSQVGAPAGTIIDVADLMYNVPARQKFMKGDPTETSHITDVVTKLALAHSDVHMRLVHGGRTTLHAPVHASRFERVKGILGARVRGNMVEVHGEERGVRVTAFLAPPERAQSTSRGLQIFVGRRPVRDRGILHAVCMGYGELLQKRRYPVAVLFIEVPDPEVDVNVHPQKLEVRFADPQRVYAAVRHTVTRGAAEAPWLQQAQAQGPAPVSLKTWPAAPAGRVPSFTRASELAERYARGTERMLIPRRAPRRDGAGHSAAGSMAERRPEPPPLSPMVANAPSLASKPEPSPQAHREMDGFFGQLRYLGQLDRTYLVCEREGELVLIDQHAAHERIAFARLKERFKERQLPVQRLLFPQRIELDEAQAQVASEAKDALATVGFELEPFGGDSWAIKAIPADVREQEVAEVCKTLLAELACNGGSRAVEERIDNVLATIACHSVVRAGDVLDAREAEALLVSLDTIPFRGFCPHGRPVLLRMQIDEIARRFGRT